MAKSFHENEIHFLHRLTSAPKRFIDSFFTPVSVKRYHLLSHELYHTSCPKYNNPPVKLSLNISFVLLFFYIVRSGLLRFYIENVQTLLILGLGLVAFIFDTAGSKRFRTDCFCYRRRSYPWIAVIPVQNESCRYNAD